MLSLREKMRNGNDFLIGVELVTTRGTMSETKSVQTRSLASQLVESDRIDWVSITDNAGGNPMLSPMALGKTVLYADKEVLIHLSCKDFNRNGLESEAWQLASEGFHNILALTGDYPGTGYGGRSKPVFDIDSVGLLQLLGEMNQGLHRPGLDPHARRGSLVKNKLERPLKPTNFYLGAVATNFKLHENEVVPQYLKLVKKIEVGAQFVIAQIGFDARKSHEMKGFLSNRGYGHIPLIGNVFLLSLPVARFFRSQKIPGVVISDELLAECERQAKSADKGRAYFKQLAARQVAVFRGLGFRGAYLGGVHSIDEILEIVTTADSFAADDWQQFAREIRYSRPGEFFLYDEDCESGLSAPKRLHPDYRASVESPSPSRYVTWGYRFSKLMHDWVFTPSSSWFRWGQRIYRASKNPHQGPRMLRIIEKASKSAMFACKDCGDCSLPDIAFLCPESQCAKNQRNGPCGGTRDGQCEVDDFPCIWSQAYDRLKYEGRQEALLEHAPVIQDESLRGTSSWANTFLERDHHSTLPGPRSASDTADPKKNPGERPIDSPRDSPGDSPAADDQSTPINSSV